ncbi:MAG: phosphoribosylanthranilate isomerase [Pseudomonadales bacterium]|nr:phosphoribosylanthranilate isomerase [Pseudomonadales bacterium]
MRTRVKICGIKSSDAIDAAVAAGADALGFNMYKSSTRYVGPEETANLLVQIPPLVTKVGLFVNHSADEVSAIIEQCRFDVLQFHGDESNEFCSAFSMPFIKAIRVEQNTDIEAAVATYPNSSGVLLDSHIPGQFGGTGTTFDWSKIPVLDTPVLLAGGLTADNAGRAIDLVHPYAVDVSGGVESSAGVKDAHLITKFIEAVQMERQS